MAGAALKVVPAWEAQPWYSHLLHLAVKRNSPPKSFPPGHFLVNESTDPINCQSNLNGNNFSKKDQKLNALRENLLLTFRGGPSLISLPWAPGEPLVNYKSLRLLFAVVTRNQNKLMRDLDDSTINDLLHQFQYSTRCTYSVAVNWCFDYCSTYNISKYNPTLNQIVSFLRGLFHFWSLQGQTVRNYANALTHLMSDASQDHMRGSVVTGLLKSFVKQHPTMPHLPPLIWNVEVVLYHLANYPPPEKLSFRLLAKKTLTLLLLATTRRRTDVLAISVDPRYLDATATRIHTILQRLSKTYSVRRKWVQELTIYKYEQDETICPYTYFIYYLKLSDRFRPKDEEGHPLVTSFFITKKGRPASSETCGNWVREVLSESGIDPNIYTLHSCRSASASYKLAKGYPLEAVLAQGGWASDHAFMKFYRRNIDVCHFKNIQFPACSAQGPEPALCQFDNSQSGLVYGQVSHIWTKYSKFRACNSRSRRHPVLPRYFRPMPLTPMNGLTFLGVHKSPVCSAAVAVPLVDLHAVDCPSVDSPIPSTSRITPSPASRT